MPVATINTMIVANAFTSGLTPSRTFENITIGSVLEPGPATNCVMTRSSHDNVKDSSQPETNAGATNGRVIRRNTVPGRAPRSSAASSRDSSNPTRRDCTTIATYAVQNVMCARMMVSMPVPCGQPIACCNVMNSSSNARPVMTSGMTSGAVVMPTSSVRPRNGPKRASATPVSVPSTTAPLAAISAIRTDSQAASRISSLPSSSPYHFNVGEWAASQTVTRRELLNENTIIDRMGAYRNISPAPSI